VGSQAFAIGAIGAAAVFVTHPIEVIAGLGVGGFVAESLLPPNHAHPDDEHSEEKGFDARTLWNELNDRELVLPYLNYSTDSNGNSGFSLRSGGLVFQVPAGGLLLGQYANRLTPAPFNLISGIRSTPWPALFNNGSGWQPIGGASQDVRFSQNSGTGNWQADEFIKNYLLGGGENYGEGFHPVSFDLE
jgi:hypothetical protein